LSQLPDEEANQAWRESPMVRPDWKPPSMSELFVVAIDCGAVQVCDACKARIQADAAGGER
jgi:hypothetical protein